MAQQAQLENMRQQSGCGMIEMVKTQRTYTMRWTILPFLICRERLRGVAPVLHRLTSGLLLRAIMVQLQSRRGMEGHSCVLGCFR